LKKFSTTEHGGRDKKRRGLLSAYLKRMADALGVSSDYLIEGTTADAAKAKFEDRELLLQFQEVEKLEEEDKQVVKKLIDAFLTKKHIQELAR
jgi:transcriptional regulator with XRE-family HTH domain